ncbi:MAG: cytochrome P450 [Candidatus Pacebacteria bacterium]|nr:cytochrome P450 [Candidatus Paceibacterota bacterium]
MTGFTPSDQGEIDLASHDSFIHGVPFNFFAKLRRDDPVYWQEMPGLDGKGKGFWSITRHSDILAINREYQDYSSAHGIRMEDQTEEEYLARRTFQETDPPEHSRLRMIVSKAFSRPVVLEYENQIREICIDVIQKALKEQKIDATKQVARQIPMRVLGQILGAKHEDFEWLVEKGDQLIANTDPEFTKHVLDQTDTDDYRLMPFRSPAGIELFDYAQKLMAEKQRIGDTEGVLSLVLQPDENGNQISVQEFRNFFCLLVAAGNDTTRYSIAATLFALASRPALVKQLQEAARNGGNDSEVWALAADEMIRWASPTMHFRRTAKRDMVLHGKTIKKGDKVILWFVSGNRDETVFEDPHEINLSRNPNPHIAFGQGGVHVCLGMWLARLEVKVFLQEWIARVGAMDLTEPHRYLRSNFIGGIKSLPMDITKGGSDKVALQIQSDNPP